MNRRTFLFLSAGGLVSGRCLVGSAREPDAGSIMNRVLVSHDAGWYRPGEPNGGAFRGFETVERRLVPALTAAGWTPDQLDQLLVRNPSAAFTVGHRGR